MEAQQALATIDDDRVQSTGEGDDKQASPNPKQHIHLKVNLYLLGFLFVYMSTIRSNLSLS